MPLLIEVLHVVAFFIVKILEVIVLIQSIPYYFMKSKRCPPINNNILLMNATTLAETIRNREIKCETVIQAYITRIIEVNPTINAVVENCFAEALKQACSIDETLASTTLTSDELKARYPLLGVPITIKGSIAVTGLDHGSGRVFPSGKKASKDAHVVQLIRKAGGVPLLVSNTPELCMALETYNNVTGTTKNPYDTRRTVGGSSGGEAALLSAGASLIGIGSDLVGSIRLPAYYCGIWGHKPTPKTVSVDGHYPDSREREIWTSLLTIGPMSRYAPDLLLLYKVIAENPLHIDEEVFLQNINYYIMENDGGSILTHSVENDIIYAMRMFKRHLEDKYQIKVKRLKVDFSNVEIVLLKTLGFKEIDTLFDKGSPGPYSELLRYITGQSKATFLPILQGILNGIAVRLPYLIKTWPDYKLAKTKETVLSILGSNGVLIYPTHPTAAHFHGQMLGRYFDYHYTAIFNGLGMPATTCPIGLNSKGLPIGLQIAAAPDNDRLTLAVAREVEAVFGGWISPSKTNVE